MSRRVRRKVSRKGKEKILLPSYHELNPDENDDDFTFSRLSISQNSIKTLPFSSELNPIDWTTLPDDTVIHLFSLLNYRDRASLASSCKAWRNMGSSPCLWDSLDMRAHRFDASTAMSLSSRCSNLRRLRFSDAKGGEAIVHLKARSLREISGDYCRKMSDSTLSVIAARHELLESLELGPGFCDIISSDAIQAIAVCCPRLRKLSLCGVREIDSDAINALAVNCPNLCEIGFMGCVEIDETALGNVSSLRFLSVAGTWNLKWGVASNMWSKLPNLVGLDVSRTDISVAAASKMLCCCQSLRVLFALNCTHIEEDANFVMSSNGSKGKLLLTLVNDISIGVGSLFLDNSIKGRNVFLDWRDIKRKDRRLDEIMSWLEWVLSYSLLRIAENNLPIPGLDNFWISQGATLLLSLMQSLKEDVQERAAMALATFVVVDDENMSIDCQRAEAVMRGGGVQLLLSLARSWREGLQAESAKAIANLSVNANIAKAVADGGGITILANLARSMNKLVAEEAAGGLWNLSVGEEYKGAIAEAGGVKALVDLIFKWSTGGDGVLERAAGALANLAADDKCSREVALAGGVRILVKLARNSKFEGVQEQAARALANLAAHGDNNSNNSAVGQEAGALEALMQLTKSPHEGVRQEAAGALWNLSFDDRNREAIAAAGGIEALVVLAQSCSNACPDLQERVAGALWGLSVSETNSIAIGCEGGIAPLIELARSEAEDVHETAAGALWNLAYNPSNALRIVEEGGVLVLVHLCSSSASKMARFMAALTLAYMFDGRIDDIALVGTSSEGVSNCVSLDGAKRLALQQIEEFVLSFSDPQAIAAAAASSAPAALAPVAQAARIQEAGQLRCSGGEIGRYIIMLRNPSSILKTCATFALLQFTVPDGRHAPHHATLLQNAGASRVLRGAAAAGNAPLEAKVYARIVIRNLEQHVVEICL